MSTHWLITDKGDPDVRALVDGVSFGGKPHYSRQTPGATSYTRNGQNLVFVTEDLKAAWITFRPTPGKATRTDGLNAWENSLFRNEGALDRRVLSSDLIREAVELSMVLWGPMPPDGMITFIKPECVKPKRDPGYCYLKAGWVRAGAAKDGKPRLRATPPRLVRPITEWQWRGERGGKLRTWATPEMLALLA